MNIDELRDKKTSHVSEMARVAIGSIASCRHRMTSKTDKIGVFITKNNASVIPGTLISNEFYTFTCDIFRLMS